MFVHSVLRSGSSRHYTCNNSTIWYGTYKFRLSSYFFSRLWAQNIKSNWTRRKRYVIGINKSKLILNDSDWIWFKLLETVFLWSILFIVVKLHLLFSRLVPVIFLKIRFQIQLFKTSTSTHRTLCDFLFEFNTDFKAVISYLLCSHVFWNYKQAKTLL